MDARPSSQADSGAATPGGAGIASILAASTMTVMAGATIAPSLPSMAAAFADVPNAEFLVRLVITVTSAAIAVSAMPLGMLADRVGRIRLMTASIALYVVAGSAGLWVDSLWALLASRVALGVAVGGIMTSATALIGGYFEGARRATMLGRQAAAMGFGGVLFISLGGLLAETGWRGPFLVYLLPAALVVLVPLSLAEPSTAPQPGDPATPVREPQRLRYTLYLGALLAMAAFYAVPVQLPFLLVERGLPEPALGGLAIAGITLVAALSSLLQARAARRIPPHRLAPICAGILGAGLLWIWAAPGLGSMMPGLALVGIGMGALMPGLSGVTMQIAPRARLGRVMGGMTTALFLGQFASPLLLQPAVARFGTAAAFLAASALAAACALVLARARARPAAA